MRAWWNTLYWFVFFLPCSTQTDLQDLLNKKYTNITQVVDSSRFFTFPINILVIHASYQCRSDSWRFHNWTIKFKFFAKKKKPVSTVWETCFYAYFFAPNAFIIIHTAPLLQVLRVKYYYHIIYITYILYYIMLIHNVVTCKRNIIYNNLHVKIYIMVICVTRHASASVMEWPIQYYVST